MAIPVCTLGGLLHQPGAVVFMRLTALLAACTKSLVARSWNPVRAYWAWQLDIWNKGIKRLPKVLGRPSATYTPPCAFPSQNTHPAYTYWQSNMMPVAYTVRVLLIIYTLNFGIALFCAGEIVGDVRGSAFSVPFGVVLSRIAWAPWTILSSLAGCVTRLVVETLLGATFQTVMQPGAHPIFIITTVVTTEVLIPLALLVGVLSLVRRAGLTIARLQMSAMRRLSDYSPVASWTLQSLAAEWQFAWLLRPHGGPMATCVAVCYVASVWHNWTYLRNAMSAEGVPEKLYNFLAPCYALILHIVYYDIYASPKHLYPCTIRKEIGREALHMTLDEIKDVQSHHSHPHACAERNASDTAIDRFINNLGAVPYSIQLSNSECLRGVEGSLVHHWPVDHHHAERHDAIRSSQGSERPHIFKLIDTDYYIDPHQLAWMGEPFVLHTFDPKKPAGSYGDVTWTTLVTGEVEMRVTGGANQGNGYRHKLWDWSADSFDAYYPGVCINYGVQKISIDTHWAIVVCYPRSVSGYECSEHQYTVPPAGTCLCHSTTLRRVNSVRPTINLHGKPSHLCVMRAIGTGQLSVSAPGEFESLHITPQTETMLKSRFANTKVKFHELATMLSTDLVQDPRFAQAVISGWWDAGSKALDAQWYTPHQERELRTHVYSAAKPDMFAEFKETMRLFMRPIIDGRMYAPLTSAANDRYCIAGRMEVCATNQPRFTTKYENYALDFMRYFVPDRGTYAPCDIEEVLEAQGVRATKRAANEESCKWLLEYLTAGSTEVKNFLKAEGYAGVKPPRGISTLPNAHCLWYSMFTLSAAKVLKKRPWYAFGHAPSVVASRVHSIAVMSKTLTASDFNRFDGTHSHALYMLERQILLALFPAVYHPVIIALHTELANASGRSTAGLRFHMGGMRKSGAADTSLFNSIDNAFWAYCAYRNQGMTHSAATEALEGKLLVGGDDGLAGDIPADVANKTATELGLSMKAVCKPAWETTDFLARIYLAPRENGASICDVLRQLSKLHSHSTRGYTDQEIAVHKAEGMAYFDADTPIIGAWVKRVNQLFGTKAVLKDDNDAKKLTQWAVLNAKQQFADDRDKLVKADKEQAYAYVAKILQTTVDNVKEYEAYIAVSNPLDLEPFIEFPEEAPPPGIVAGVHTGVAPAAVPQVAPPAPKPAPPVQATGVPVAPTNVKTAGMLAARFERPADARLGVNYTLAMLPAMAVISSARIVINTIAKYAPPGTRLVDLTAGLGGHLIAALRNGRLRRDLVACETNADNLRMARSNVESANIPGAQVQWVDADGLDAAVLRPGDAVLCDPMWEDAEGKRIPLVHGTRTLQQVLDLCSVCNVVAFHVPTDHKWEAPEERKGGVAWTRVEVGITKNVKLHLFINPNVQLPATSTKCDTLETREKKTVYGVNNLPREDDDKHHWKTIRIAKPIVDSSVLRQVKPPAKFVPPHLRGAHAGAGAKPPPRTTTGGRAFGKPTVTQGQRKK